MANITTRAAKGLELTYNEVDANFTALNNELPVFHARHFGVVPGAGNNTTAIANAIDAVYGETAGTLGGARLVFPPGLFNVDTITRTFPNARTIKLQGAGRLATVFQKLGTDPTPIFDFSSGVLDTPMQGVDFADFTIIGNTRVNPGIRLTLLHNFTFNRVSMFGCSTALDLVGSLIFSAHDCVLTGNEIGLRTRKYPRPGFAGNGIFCNSWTFNGGTINSNTTYGLDIGDADGVYIRGTNMERNGDLNNLDVVGTGAIIIRSTVVDESVYSVINMDGVWFELNYGRMVEVEAAAGLELAFRNCHVDGPAEGNSTINVGAIRRLIIDNFPMRRAANAVISNAASTVIIGSEPFNYTGTPNTTARVGQPHTELVATETRAVTAAENGRTFFMQRNAGIAFTLPAPALGLRYRFSVYLAPTTGSYTIGTNGGTNVMAGRYQDALGEQVSFGSADTITFVQGFAQYTDYLEVLCDGVGWHCQAYSRADGGITASAVTP